MRETVPNYYHKFQCIAQKCTHNCCIGWEIDIDEDTMELYNNLNTPMGEKIRESIEGEIPHFILQEGERCPFLNDDGLCNIICEYGEDALCDICYLHPRFKNFYFSFEETGLGLCCEEAARIILSDEEKFSICMPDDVLEEERDFFVKRQEIFDILQNRNKSMGERFFELANTFEVGLDFKLNELCELYLSLERLDDKWTNELKLLKQHSFNKKIFDDIKLQIPFEQLAVYFIFRHLKMGDILSAVKMTLVSCYFIGALFDCYMSSFGYINNEKIIDIVRMYSAEMEYSDENLQALMAV